jgi:hypothetical protein
MTQFYHGPAKDGEPPPLTRHDWMLASYCHARALDLPAGMAAEYCRRYLPLGFLGARLTTEIVLRSLVFPPPGSCT